MIDRAAEARDEAEQARARLFDAIESITEGFVLFDANDRIVLCNSRYRRFFAELAGDDVGSLVVEGTKFEDFLRAAYARGMFPDQEPNADRWVERIMQRRREPQGPRERPLADGRWLQVSERRTQDGGLVAIYADITERKRAEEATRAARDAAEAALRELQTAQASLVHAQKMAALGQLTAGVAHEIKNPLNFVNNFAGLSAELLDELKEATVPAMAMLDADKRAEIDETIEVLTGNLGKIVEHGRRADNIVKSMLAHSRGTSGERQSVDINALVEEALNLAYHGARAQDQSFNITLECDFAQPLAPIELVPQDITRVFLNLFGNGFYAANKRREKAGDGTFKPVLKVTTRELNGAVKIAVRDNGIGIAPEHREKLFQPFFTTKPTGEGTGLGLSISYDIVTQQHGGTMSVDSRFGEFTEFTVRLPRASARKTL
jgi:signal transduction histidine kinase